ncbi:hypothetical protein BO70DRAFT_419943 [Aspergillus heteromorphus CBS 117.55]|uniref:ubiquitinyl hydrolase 1 n=1 Tax=Aspergillus heteromorphus CBS 117.55 TaxID=1448321 RepID=A0A317WRC3_9EURO|nr:uncharacterized protein BO70DRAFT_419943 [Aspergillus heteromorphus CBS 117.55]PWY88271.1 hypothetical protein BO70DRAFT_419943 [Aspergillus heteromorphus CBS 117.55]
MPSPRVLADTFRHVALPPKLPGKQDKDPTEVDGELITRLRHAIQDLTSATDEEAKGVWSSIDQTLGTFCTVNNDGMVNKAALLGAFGKLRPGNAVIVYVAEQNAALLIRCPRGEECDDIIIEAFETSSRMEQALAAKGALVWDFPSSAVSLPMEEFRNSGFQDSLCDFLENASTEALDEFAAKTRKAGKEVVENRDTVDPSLITDFLMTLLEVNGSRICPPLLRKRVKDDVCWDNSELPWRRSPSWLVLRVCLQRVLYLRLGSELGRLFYKALMCVVMARLLRDTVHIGALTPEDWGWLRSKLCRRLAKLEAEKVNSPSSVQDMHTRLVKTLEPIFEQCIDAAQMAIEKSWEAFKRETQRKIPLLPSRAEESDYRLSLPNSLAYLQDILKDPWISTQKITNVDPALVVESARGSTTQQFSSILTRYTLLAELELGLESGTRKIPVSKDAAEGVCIQIADKIGHYMATVADTYVEDPEQLGLFILNLFDLWVYLDKCATVAYPLLTEYHTGFPPELLDVLLVSRLADLKRLQNVQTYLHKRCTGAVKAKMTIFADPCPGCLADRYLDLPIGNNLAELQERIETASLAAREQKVLELFKLKKEYDSLKEKEMGNPCTQKRKDDGTHDIRGCTHCYYVRCRGRMTIDIHEDFLPPNTNMAEKRAIVFELGIPKAFSAYRTITWEITNKLSTLTSFKSGREPEILLHEYSLLADHRKAGSSPSLSLASSTKSHLNTHFKTKRLPTSTDSVLRPLGLTFFYYDTGRKLWAKDKPPLLTLAHHFTLSLPKTLPFSELYSCSSFSPDGAGPSSYEAVANIPDCPSSVTVHEFMAHQTLMAGRNRRWLSILTELGSSNLNLGLHDTMVLFRHLALQAGPGLRDNPLRVVHAIFKDSEFCKRLIEQLDQHVSIAAQNWRETTYMDTILTLAIQVCNLGSRKSSKAADGLLLRIRRITLQWIEHIKNENQTVLQVDAAERAANYRFLASLLCRRTFSPQSFSGQPLTMEGVQCFVEATLAMQESVIGDVSKFNKSTLSMLSRDIKMCVRIRAMVQAAVEVYPEGITGAIDRVFPGSISRSYSPWRHLPHPHECWITATVRCANERMVQQEIHFHILEGHILVDGIPLGKLPSDISNSETLKELFGNQRLFAFPSNLPGMNYALAIDKEGYQIHLGYRGNDLIIRACKDMSILEYVPRSVFGRGRSLDLPEPLVFGCVHWIDLRTGILEARRMPVIWKERPGNWRVNVPSRKAQRKHSLLVDPHSTLATIIGKAFLHFEHSSRLTIYQPRCNPLSVEMKYMNISFHVNKKQLLQCKELGAELDPNQDAGTLYGLQSMLVLRNVSNRSQRSLIMTLGDIEYRRHGIHVLVRKMNDNSFGRYMIDDVLGRLSCPAERRLQYTKAQLHAFTSFVLPDLLTGRTGAEEALACLHSGGCQPWTPLNQASVDLLQTISHLTPTRRYYPRDMRSQQLIEWDEKLTVSIQNEEYQSAIESILSRSKRLSLFDATAAPAAMEVTFNEVHLRERARWRRSIYARSSNMCRVKVNTPDKVYSPAGTCFSDRASNVLEIVSLLRERPFAIRTTRNLSGILQKWPYIGGYMTKFTPLDLETTLSADLAVEWGGLVRFCRECGPQDSHYLMFHLGLMAYKNAVDMDAMRVLAAFSILSDLKELPLPSYPSFEGFPDTEKPDFDSLLALIKPFWKEYAEPSSSKGERSAAEVYEMERARNKHDWCCENASNDLATFILQQWPCAEPSVSGFSSQFLEIAGAHEIISREWLRRYKNLQLMNHIVGIQEVLNNHEAERNHWKAFAAPQATEVFRTRVLQLQDVTMRLERGLPKSQSGSHSSLRFDHNTFTSDPLGEIDPNTGMRRRRMYPKEVTEIEQIVDRIANSGCSVRSTYGQDLQLSIDALKKKRRDQRKIHTAYPRLGGEFEEGMSIYFNEIRRARVELRRSYILIYDRLSARDAQSRWLQEGRLWGCVTPVTVLEQLRSVSSFDLGPNMKQAIVSYALDIVKLQRLIRMKESFTKRDQSGLDQEQSHCDHAVWDYMMHPDWIILEIDANMQIRQDQVTVAMEMVSPSSNSNSVLQMNMGQGKTSVIMPMVASALADGKILNRLLVPKALIAQTAQILQARLGGLVGRSLVHIPFSRRTPTTPQVLQEYRALHEDMLKSSGIVLGVPEHSLSFKLSGLQQVSDMKLPEAVKMVAIQTWLDKVGRDILDECDFTLAVKTQLIYPSGSQLVVDGHPDRWEVIMAVLELVAQHLRDLARELPQSIDLVERTATAFPIAYLLRKDVEVVLAERIAEDVCLGRGAILPVRIWDAAEIDVIKQFICQDTLDESVGERAEYLLRDAPKVRKRAHLIRGLLVHRILLLCLKKRWNVQYGLHPDRDPMAVPFHAKGVPSEHAEWGHPDVAILFTCLAFYHQGLNQSQCRESLQAILRSDDPATEYDRWTQGSTALPEALRHWNIINVDDEGQVREIWLNLRHSIMVINHFLRHFVFPVHAKQFAIKLQTSGWDVPMFSNSVSKAHNPKIKRSGLTTGFSGTNDNRRLLPLTIEQHDLPELSYTNAEVLTYLLQQRNRGYRPAVLNGRRLSEEQLLMELKQSKIRVLIDAGAFILEMDNQTLVKAWLAVDHEAQAAVYFGADNKAWVQYQNGLNTPLLATPFADDMSECLIYLDEAHTRGTDLKLPANAVGALTLGLNQTKDHTVQAAMRLRQLGTTQSIVFISPPEVHQSIMDTCEKGPGDSIDSSDVIYWLLHQTCANNKDLEPLFFAQGVDFCRRVQAAEKNTNFLHDFSHRTAYMQVLQQPEQQTLEQLYKPLASGANDTGVGAESNSQPLEGKVAGFMKALRERHRQTHTTSTSIVSSALEEVEQEREVAYEIEEERQVQRPQKLDPHKFPGLHPSLEQFAKTGTLKELGVVDAALAVDLTKLGRKYGVRSAAFLTRLYVSAEFRLTVKLKHAEKRDDHLRPVNWILCNVKTETAVILIPEEAELLIPIMRTSPARSMHLLTYAAPVTKRMLHFNSLTYHAVPSLPAQHTFSPRLTFEVGIFAGRLYFKYSEYEFILQQLGLTSARPSDSLGNRMAFLQEWLALRRQGQDISHTPMGYVCERRNLRADHPFFAIADPVNGGGILQSSGFVAESRDEEEFDSGEDDTGLQENEDGDGGDDHFEEVKGYTRGEVGDEADDDEEDDEED